MSKSQQNAAQKQSCIVQAAYDLFLQQGYGITSMDSIASEAGVTKQTVYRYFPSKEELFSAVMEKIRREEVAPYGFATGSVEQELSGFAAWLLEFHLSPAALSVYRMMLTEGGNENLLQPFMETGPKRVMQPLLEFLQQRYPALNDSGFYARMFANMVLAPRNELLMQGKQSLARTAQREHVTKVVRLFLKAIEG